MAGHVFNVCFEAKAAKHSRSVIDGAASTLCCLVLQGIRCRQELEFSGNTWSSVVTIGLSILLLVIFLSVPRGRDDSHHGSPVGRRNTASLMEFLTFLWPRKTFQVENLMKKDI